MKTKYLISIAAAMMFMLASLVTQAQDVYEYATINYAATEYKIYISYSNGKYDELVIDKVKGSYNTAPALSLMSKMAQEGWEVINSNGEGPYWRFFLKRKVK